MVFDGLSKVRHFLEVLAFSLAIASIQYAFTPERPYASMVTYSMFIGLTIWAVIDLGREFVPSAQETGWPQGWQGVALVAVGIVSGFGIGRALADRVCRAFGFYAGYPPPDPTIELRNAVIITLLAGIAGTYYFYSKSRSDYLERRMGEAQRHAAEARLKLLESQLDPHMLFNTLANLRALIALDPAQAQTMLDQLIDYLRATLAASRATTHPLQAEFDRLRDYLALMTIRMGPRLTVTFNLPSELAALSVPTLVLQPLVENAIRHGLEPKVGAGTLDIRAEERDGQLVLHVTDDGIGLRAAADVGSRGTGFGLGQVSERLATLHGAAARLELSAVAGGGTRASIHLPLAASN